MLHIHELFSIICALSVGLGILFEKKLSIQPTVALLMTSTIITAGIYYSNIAFLEPLSLQILHLPFGEIFLSYMLGLLLFAGAVHVKVDNIIKVRYEIALLALFSTLLSIGLIGAFIHVLSSLIFIPFEWIDCFIFGAIISPTDPIAVLGLLKELKAPEKLTTLIAGESLFNDGIGIVVFNTLCAVKWGISSPSTFTILHSFVTMSAGGIGLGLISYWLLKLIFKHPMTFTQKIMLMIAFVVCGYEVAELIHISGALFVVTLGLSTNHLIKKNADKLIIFSFWEVIDEFLNLILFLMMGVVTLQISDQIQMNEIYFGILSIPLVILARWMSVKMAMKIASTQKKLPKNLDIVISWAGLRGALAVALALSSPNLDSNIYHTLLVITHTNVMFSVIIQGLTSKPLLKWYINGQTSHTT